MRPFDSPRALLLAFGCCLVTGIAVYGVTWVITALFGRSR
jgi:hypothetical protein